MSYFSDMKLTACHWGTKSFEFT